MDFLPVATPQSESELAVMVSLLEANRIPHYVHNQGFGSLYPGLQIGSYNERRIMVASDRVAAAHALLAEFLSPPCESVAPEQIMTTKDKLRRVLESCVSGWSFSGNRRKTGNDENAL